jgi:predicted nucleic acid-binding protein
VVDAIVVTTAVRHQAPIVTSDRGDLSRIADAIGVKIKFFPT